MTVRQRFPASQGKTADNVGDLLSRLRQPPPGGPLTFGDQRLIDFLTGFARRLLAPALARRFPELASLGFFLRKGEIARELSTIDTNPDVLRFPRGLVFHVPPANVDTVFVYSWALSALAGNRNVVRISPRAGGAAGAVLDALNDALADADPAIAATQVMISYDRDDTITGELSANCDLRVIWGGDAAVRAIRQHPLAPHARDVTFPDRASFSAISVDGWRAATNEEKTQAVQGFYNDAYWFDQAACSSPRTLFWVGDERSATDARAKFIELLGVTVDKRMFHVEPSMAVQKRVGSYGAAAEGIVDAIRFAGNAITTVELAPGTMALRDWLGVGTFGHMTVAKLADLADIVTRKDQTLTHFGFQHGELVDLARRLGGCGIDRIVPFGKALSFAAIWDGYRLLAEFSRLTTIEA
ncbi:MAG: gamma-glutamyl phosphate reductase [Sciscionella sp.]|nr:gamma-glutamyl phosphate reductase [Sciscionella sp.]